MSTFTLARALRPRPFLEATIVTTLDGKTIHWTCSEKTLRDIEACLQNGASELLKFLIRAHYTEEGLTTKEYVLAELRISMTPETEEHCRNEVTGCSKPAIGDIGLCRTHALAVLHSEPLA